MTEYRVVEGFPAYRIYEDGRLWSTHVGRFLKPFPISRRNRKTGEKRYLAFKLCLNGFEKTEQVHRLVAKHFIDNPQNLPEVNHKDGNPANNHRTNLEWMTHAENVQHAFDIGLNNGENWQGQKHSRSTYTDEEVHKICQMFQSGTKPKDIAPSTSAEYQKLFRIWNRDNWKFISKNYIW